MKNPEFERLKISLDEIEEQIDEIDLNELEERVYKLEREINSNLEMCHESENASFQKLLKRINTIKKENDFYDEEATDDMMFPDRHDDDFDEDSMSNDSVFGGD
jgi:hypothetical protein